MLAQQIHAVIVAVGRAHNGVNVEWLGFVIGEEHARVMGEFNQDDDIVIHCRSGVRSGKACNVLRAAGFQHVRNVVGGILAWSDQVDPSVPKY